MIDSHTHLHLCEQPDADLVSEAAAAGVSHMLTVATDAAGCHAVLAAAESFDGVWAAVGCHPNNADEIDAPLLRTLASHPRCVAIGETGFDFYREGAPRAAQERAFAEQIELARDLDKPLLIHTREAALETLEMLRAYAGGLRVLLHCFSIPERVEECVAEGWWISYAGNVTYPANRALAESISSVPLDRLLVETDAPYLSPQSRRGRPNTPAGVLDTAAFVASARGITLAALDEALTSTAAALFGW